MGRADIRTLLPMDVWAKHFGISPLAFNGIYSQYASEAHACGRITPQYSWQTPDQVGRDDIANAIFQAEERIKDRLVYPVAPDWIIEERQQFDRIRNPLMTRFGMMNLRGTPISVVADNGMFLYGGRRATTLIEAGATVTYSDEDNDNYNETATVVVSTSLTDANEISVFYPGHNADPAWEIRPIKLTIAADTVTITFRRELAVLEELTEKLTSVGINGDEDANFLTTVDVYRVWNDPQSQARVIWNAGSLPCTCIDNSCASCTVNIHSACLSSKDRIRGVIGVMLADWDADNDRFIAGSGICPTVQPDAVDMWYRAGYVGRTSRPIVEMDPVLSWCVSILAVTYLDRPICSCDTVRAYIQWWKEDLSAEAARQNTSSSYKVSDAMLNCPFGTTRGAIEVWKKLSLGAWAIGR